MHESEIQVQGNQRFFFLAASRLVLAASRLTHRKKKRKTSGTRVVQSKQLLCFVQGQGQKSEQKHITKSFDEFHNHSASINYVISNQQIKFRKKSYCEFYFDGITLLCRAFVDRLIVNDEKIASANKHPIIQDQSAKIIPYSRPKWQKSIPFFWLKWLKNHTFWAAHTYIAHKGVCPGTAQIFTYQV